MGYCRRRSEQRAFHPPAGFLAHFGGQNSSLGISAHRTPTSFFLHVKAGCARM